MRKKEKQRDREAEREIEQIERERASERSERRESGDPSTGANKKRLVADTGIIGEQGPCNCSTEGKNRDDAASVSLFISLFPFYQG